MMLVCIMYSVGVNNMNIMNSINMFSDSEM